MIFVYCFRMLFNLSDEQSFNVPVETNIFFINFLCFFNCFCWMSHRSRFGTNDVSFSISITIYRKGDDVVFERQFAFYLQKWIMDLLGKQAQNGNESKENYFSHKFLVDNSLRFKTVVGHLERFSNERF